MTTKSANGVKFIIKATGSMAERAWHSGLIVLPPRIWGARCTECKFVDPEKEYCNNRKVMQPLAEGRDRMCCNYYEAKGMKKEGHE